jgi:hypothetical protein
MWFASVQGEQNPKLLERLVSFDPSTTSVMAAAKLGRIIAEPEFNIVQVWSVISSRSSG